MKKMIKGEEDRPSLSPAERIRRWAGWPEWMSRFDPTKHIVVWFEGATGPGRARQPSLHSLIRERGLEARWGQELFEILYTERHLIPSTLLWDQQAMATARQRAKALLRVIGEET